ncbi:hypothetical protein V2J09_012132 [Rumex salicifolius]
MASFRSIKSEVYEREERKQQYQSYIRGLNAYDRHKKFVRDYVSYYGEGQPSVEKVPIKTDQDTLREGYRFIRTEEDDMDTSWEQRLVKRYYSKLFKEYCIADMSKYKSGKIGLRWRTEKEVRSGKGQFICGNKHCDEKNDMARENKQALVKLVACNRCAEKLHYRRSKEKEKLERKEKEESNKKRERSMSHDSDTDSECQLKDNRKRKDIRLSEDGGKQERRTDETTRKSSKLDSTDKSLKNRELHRKGKEKETLADEHVVKNDDETFDEFMEGMFP